MFRLAAWLAGAGVLGTGASMGGEGDDRWEAGGWCGGAAEGGESRCDRRALHVGRLLELPGCRRGIEPVVSTTSVGGRRAAAWRTRRLLGRTGLAGSIFIRQLLGAAIGVRRARVQNRGDLHTPTTHRWASANGRQRPRGYTTSDRSSRERPEVERRCPGASRCACREAADRCRRA